MEASIISLPRLSLSLLPALAVLGILYYWAMDYKTALTALIRMLVQLLLIGFALGWLFGIQQMLPVLGILVLMLMIASWISLRTIVHFRRRLYFRAFSAIAFGGSLSLLVMIVAVLNVSPWFTPQFVIPLAGMFFANAMNSVSVTAERLDSELARGETVESARKQALGAGLIPITNSLFAVGLVSLPGMMTGQILAGVSPLIAVRYQIAIMSLVFAAAGIASVIFIILSVRQMKQEANS